MKNLSVIFYNNDWYCPYCEQLNNTERIENEVQCSWCKCISKVPKIVLAIFLHDCIKKRKKEMSWTI
jgi:hypothetical protein